MINASTAFHNAILETNPDERALLLFADPTAGAIPSISSTRMAWTNEDIAANGGLQITESVNENREFSIGQVTSASVAVSIFNDHGYLTNYLSQLNYDLDCRIYLGVRTATDTNRPVDANCVAYSNYASGARVPITGHSTYPYLRLAGMDITPSSSVPGLLDYPICGLIVEDDPVSGRAQIVAIGEEPGHFYFVGYHYGSTWGDIDDVTWGSLSSTAWGDLLGTEDGSGPATSYYMYMQKYPSIAAKRLGYIVNGTTLYECKTDGTVDKFEYAPLGIFNFDQPQEKNSYIIPFTAYDRMTLLDKDISSWLGTVTFPCQLYALYTGLCTECGVTNAMAGTEAVLLNKTLSIAEKPDLGTNCTGRKLLQYIAEAMGCNARMNRNGELELCYYHSVADYIINGLPNANPYHPVYETSIGNYNIAQITGVSLETPQEDSDPVTVLVGTDSNIYRLSANPLLQNVDTTVVGTNITPIKNRLVQFPYFPPISFSTTCDWTVQAGDCVQLRYLPAGSSTVTSAIVPVYTQTIRFNGIAEVVYENRGSPTRPIDAFAYGSLHQQITMQKAQTRAMIAGEDAKSSSTYLSKTGDAYRTLSIPFGTVDGTSTKKLLTATVPGITELRDGVCAYIKNGVVSSASGCTLNVNGLGAKPIYQTMAAATAVTTTFNINYTMLFVYNSSRVSGGCWDMYYGYNSNTTYTNMSLGNGYGTCATSTASATVLLESFALKLGGYISVKFTNDLPANATLTVNGTTAKAVYYRGSANTAGDIVAGDIATFVYDGTNYVMVANDRWGKEGGGGGSASEVTYITCSTAASTAAKTATASGVTQTTGTFLTVLFSNGNTAETPTFALNSGTALPLISCYTNAAISSTAITTGMTAMLLCNGSSWVLLNPKQSSFLAEYTQSSPNTPVAK